MAGRDFSPGLCDRAGPPVADGRFAASGRRRAGRGVGKAALEAIRIRIAGAWRASPKRRSGSCTPDSRAILAAYARGVNYFIETHRGLSSARIRPAALRSPALERVRDSLLVILQMNRMLTATWREEMNKFQMLQGGDAAKVNFLYPRRTGSEVQPGSNAWAISRRALRRRQTDPGQRSAPGLERARRVAPGPPKGPRSRSHAARPCPGFRASSSVTIAASPGA